MKNGKGESEDGMELLCSSFDSSRDDWTNSWKGETRLITLVQAKNLASPIPLPLISLMFQVWSVGFFRRKLKTIRLFNSFEIFLQGTLGFHRLVAEGYAYLKWNGGFLLPAQPEFTLQCFHIRHSRHTFSSIKFKTRTTFLSESQIHDFHCILHER